MTIGANIIFFRKKERLTQDELSSRLNVARQTVSSWERDIFSPDSNSLIALSRLFNCTTDELLGLNPPPPPATESDAPGAEDKTAEAVA